jgi:hypothetical protein
MNSLRSQSRKNATRSTAKKKGSGKSSGNGGNGQEDSKTKRRTPAPYADSSLQTGQTKRAKKPPRREEDYMPVEESEPKPRKRTVKREIET